MTLEPERPQSRPRVSGGLVAALVGLAVLIIFIVQNTESVRFQFLMLRFSWPLWLYTIATAVVGALVWYGLELLRRHRRRPARADYRR